MFSNVVVTRHYAWTQSSETLFDDDVMNQSTQDVNVNEEENLEEGSGDSEEDDIPNYIDHVCNLVVVNMGNNSIKNYSEKRKTRKQCDGQSKKKSKKPYKFGAQLLSYWDHLLDRVSIRNDSMDKIGCSISEVMAEVHSILKITFDDELYYFATEYFSMRKKKRDVGIN
jgi:hypothetical protein